MGGRLLDWLGAGVAADLPLAASMPAKLVPDSTAFYYSTDTQILNVFDPSGPSWFSIDMAAITALSTESIQDMIAAFLAAGTGITLTYNDAGNLLTIAGTVTQYTDEMAQDAVAAMIAAGTDTGITIVYNDAGNAIAFTITVATASDIWGGTLDTAFITPKRLKDWRTPVSVADAATITLDGTLGANFYVTLGGNRILANPTNFNPGQFGVIHVVQDGTGSRTLTFGVNWKFGGVSLAGNILTTTAGAVDAIHYYVRSDGTITCFVIANLTGSPAKIKLDDLSNIDVSTPPTNGQALVYNTGSGKWKPGTIAAGSSSYPPFSPPLAAALTLNSGDATNLTLTDDTDVGLIFDGNGFVGGSLSRIATMALPTGSGAGPGDTNFDFHAQIQPTQPWSFGSVGIHLYESATGKQISFGILPSAGNGLYAWGAGSLTGFSTTIKNSALNYMPGTPLFLGFKYDQAAAIYYLMISGDAKNWSSWVSATRAASFTTRADRVGFGVMHGAAANANEKRIGSCRWYTKSW